MVLAAISEGRTDVGDIQQASLALMEEVETPVPLEERRRKK
jgi:hypothetical protein